MVANLTEIRIAKAVSAKGVAFRVLGMKAQNDAILVFLRFVFLIRTSNRAQRNIRLQCLAQGRHQT
jgi:hypothetical protein